MKKKNIKGIILIIIAVIMILAVYKNYRTWIVFLNAKEYLNKKYNITNISYKDIKKITLKHRVTVCSQECIGEHLNYKIPDTIYINYEGKIITISGDSDDYLVEELYNSVREYYAELLNININDIYILTIDDRYTYINFLMNSKTTKINNNTIKEFIKSNYEIKIYIRGTNENIKKQTITSLNENEEIIFFNDKKEIECRYRGFDSWETGADKPEYQLFKSCTIIGGK